MKAGSVAALAKVPDRGLSQSWSRYFYDAYPNIDGLLCYNAHNDEESIALYERAANALVHERSFALNDPRLRPHILEAANTNNMTITY